jgi:hypothetical protein
MKGIAPQNITAFLVDFRANADRAVSSMSSLFHFPLEKKMRCEESSSLQKEDSLCEYQPYCSIEASMEGPILSL